jgi:NitT/TauT family transport system permease protein
MTSRRIDVLLVIVALIAAWQVLFWVTGDWALTAPLPTALLALDLLGSERFHPHLLETLRGFALGYLVSALGGVGIGVWLGAHRLSGEVAEPVLVALYSLPKITLYPLVLLFFGLGISAKVAFGALHGIIPVVIFAMSAVRNIQPVYLRVGRSLRLDPLTLARTVLIPAALPEIVTGLRVGFSLTLLGVLIAEMFASRRGLGFTIINAIGQHDVKTMMAVTLILAVLATTANALLLWIEGRLHHR